MRGRLIGGRKSKSQKIAMTIAAFALAIILMVIFSVKFLSSPAVGTLSTSSPASTFGGEDKQKGPQYYNGLSVRFDVPENFRVVSNKPQGPYIDSPSFYSTDHKGIQISVGVRLEKLDSDSGVMYRREKKDIYKEQSINGGVMFLKETGGQERTIYIQHNDMLLDIAATVDGTADLATPVDKIQNSLEWK